MCGAKKAAAPAKKGKELPLFIFNQAKRRTKWEEINVCVGVDGGNLAVFSEQMNNCREFHWNMSWAVWMRTLPSLTAPLPLHSVNFQIFILHYILSSCMRRAFKQKMELFCFFCLNKVVRDGFANDVCAVQAEWAETPAEKSKLYLLYSNSPWFFSTSFNRCVLEYLLCLNKWSSIVFISSGWPKT